MNVCRDCIHFDACALFWYSDYDCVPSIEDSKKKRENDEACECFVPSADAVKVVSTNDVYLTREEAERSLALAGRIKLLKPEKWQRIPLSECYLYECCCNCTEFSCSGMSAPDGYCREHSKATDAANHCKKFKERT